ncbi:o-succinylbenzoate synthase [Natranaeroarchaeum sulfidigenes]|uniref:o-succinylbenzoate synthase n=1 Tax=Natranaeroarchaeum sulfidigenes TaxID=2784880 RepID=A0A897MPD3_9EURY|nr:o-succinylbenzoate synthase [Natranaeroarchaeum sulfidigenes]QSG02262.1 L-alanine-DL-glutamate epimerase or related enzyme of enolase superfamily [Natranaeroarchaeum sulfidigenes]
MDAEMVAFDLPLTSPLSTAAGWIERREGWALRIDSGGTTGLGEATPLPGWTESLSACRAGITDAVEQLNADDPAAALAVVEELPAARHAVSLALADLRATENDEPLYRSLGSVGRTTRVPVNATIGDVGPDVAATAAHEALGEGFRAIKLKVGNRPIEKDVDRVEAVREAVGPNVAIRVDANGAWSREQARHALTLLSGTILDYVEQPLEADDLAGLAELRELTGIDMALDESLASHSFEEIQGADAADVLVLKPMALGGLDRARRIARDARREGIRPVITTTIDGVVARAGAVHLAASLPGIDACGLATGGMLAEDLAADPAPIEEGNAVVPQYAGLGTQGPWERGDGR